MLRNTVTRRVEWGDCDPAGIVFNPQFFRWFDHCTTMLYEVTGLPKQEMLTRYGGAGCPLVETNATFRAPCTYGDDIEITSEVVEIGTKSFQIRHRLAKGGETRVEGVETRVWTVHDPERGLRGAPIPDELAARFREEV